MRGRTLQDTEELTKILKGRRKEMKDEMKKHSAEMKKEIRGIKYLLNHNQGELAHRLLLLFSSVRAKNGTQWGH